MTVKVSVLPDTDNRLQTPLGIWCWIKAMTTKRPLGNVYFLSMFFFFSFKYLRTALVTITILSQFSSTYHWIMLWCCLCTAPQDIRCSCSIFIRTYTTYTTYSILTPSPAAHHGSKNRMRHPSIHLSSQPGGRSRNSRSAISKLSIESINCLWSLNNSTFCWKAVGILQRNNDIGLYLLLTFTRSNCFFWSSIYWRSSTTETEQEHEVDE